MNPHRLALHFDAKKPVFLSLSPDGFLLNGQSLPVFNASIQSIQPLRKRFLQGKLVCFSKNGDSATNGSACSSCSLRSQCTPKLRLTLHPLDPELPSPLFIELAFSSSHNLITYLQVLQDHNLPQHSPTSFSVRSRGPWGEVLFSLLTSTS